MENLIGTREAAKILGLSREHISRMIQKGKLEGQKIGRSFVVMVESVEAYRVATEGKAKNDPTR